MSLKQKAIAGVKWTSLSSIVIAVVQLAQIAILARYLVPTDFGLMAIVSVVIGFSALFMDMGISSAIIHKQDITHKQLSSLYWLNIFAGISLFTLVYLLAPPIASFYNEERMIPLLQLLAITFFISAIGNQYRILNQKQLLFNRLAKVEIFAAISSFFVAVACALNGFGVYSLVYASLFGVCVSNLIFLLTGLKQHRPAFTYQYDEIKSLISFGLFQMGERSINYFNSQFDTILIGKLLGTEALGIYTIAKNLVIKPAQIINPIITKVTFPIMAKVQDDTRQLKNIYLKTINYLCSVNFPIYMVMAVLSESLILTLFGEKWTESILILQILAFYFMFRSIGNPIGSLQLAKGRADLGFYWNLGLFAVVPLVIYMGSIYGLVGVAISLVLLQISLNVPSWYFLVKPLCGAQFTEYFSNILKPLLITVLAVFVSLPIKMFLLENNSVVSSLIFLVVGGSFFILLTRYLNNPFWCLIKSVLIKR